MATAAGEGPRPGEALVQALFWTVLYGMTAVNALSLYRSIDADLWWHLRTGEWIAEHRTVPRVDPFSRLGHTTAAPWLAYSWLFELLLWGLYHKLGLAGVALYRLVLSLAVVASLHRLAVRSGASFTVAAPLLFLAVYSLAPMFSERPWLFSLLFFAWTLGAVLSLRAGERPRAGWLLPVVFCLWANLHIQFVYGLCVLALACLWPGAADRRRVVLLTSACLLATLMNPYHVRLCGVVLEYATQTAPFRHVQELTALPFRAASDYTVIVLAGVTAFALGRRRDTSAFDVLLLAGTAFLALRARRDIGYLCIACVPLAAAALAPHAMPRPASRGPGVLAGVCVLLIVVGGWWLLVREERLRETVRRQYPETAVEFVRRQRPSGPLFNDFDWGGYLIWALREYPVAVDGRTNLHGDERLERSLATQWGRPGWDDNPDLLDAGVVLIRRELPLAELLARDPRWRQVHADESAVVYVPAAADLHSSRSRETGTMARCIPR